MDGVPSFRWGLGGIPALAGFELTIQQGIILALGSVVLGISRTGIRGAAFLVIPVFAGVFGGRASAGIVLVLLVIGDLIAIYKYRGDARWSHIRPLLPWTLAGIVLGTLVGSVIPDRVFVRIVAVIVLVSTALMWVRDNGTGDIDVPTSPVLSGLLGIVAGFSSMVGNAAGPLMNLFFLSRGLNKDRFIGTAAWFFFIVNATKVPFHVFAWRTIDSQTMLLGFTFLPAVLAGAFAGIWIVRIIPEKRFRIVMIVLIIVAAGRLLFT